MVLVVAAGRDEHRRRLERLQRQRGGVLDPLDQRELRYRVEPFVQRVVAEQDFVVVDLEELHHVVELSSPVLTGHEPAPLAAWTPAVLGDPAHRDHHHIDLAAERLYPRDRAGTAERLIVWMRADDEHPLLPQEGVTQRLH